MFLLIFLLLPVYQSTRKPVEYMNKDTQMSDTFRNYLDFKKSRNQNEPEQHKEPGCKNIISKVDFG